MKFYTENRFTKLSLLIVCLFIIGTLCSAQTIGDFRSVSTGEWTALSTWQTYSTTGWVAAANYPGQNAGNYAVTIEQGNSISISENNFTTNSMGTITISGKLILNNNSTFYLNTEEIYVTPDLLPIPATIQFDNKSILALSTNAVLEVWEDGLSGNNFNHNQEIHVGIIYLAAGEGAPGADYFTFEELMQSGGTLNAKANVPPMSCLGDPVALVGNYSGAIGDPVTYSWSSTGPAPLDFIPNSTAKEPTVVPTVAGSYTISLTVSTKKGILLYNNTEKVTLIVLPTSSVTDKTICSSEIPYTWNGLTFTEAGTQNVTLQNIAGCDSTSTLNLSVNLSTSSITGDSICQGENYLFNGTNYSTAGTYSDTLINTVGCDSIATLELFVKLPTSSMKLDSICSNALPYSWNGLDYTISGAYTKSFLNSVGCDSIATLELLVKNPTTSITNVSICSSAFPYNWNGTIYPAAGIFTKTFTNSVGCDSIATLELLVKYPTTSTTNVSICSSVFPYNWNGTDYPVAGTFTKTLTNSVGCDSIATLNLAEKFPTVSYNTKTICSSELPYFWDGLTFNAAGTQTKNLNNIAGCDSTANFELTVIPSTNSLSKQTICSTELPYSWDGLIFNAAGTQNKNLTNAAGCDSIASFELNVKMATGSVTTDSICSASSSYTWNGTQYTFAGTYSKTFVNSVGCDSIATLELVPCSQAAETICPITISDINVCPNTNAQLNASGADYYFWSPFVGLSNATIANPTVNVTTTKSYTITAFSEKFVNLIENGDFENGNNDFTSNYTYTNANLGLGPEGLYAVGTNPKYFHNSFSACVDHTSGTGKMLIVNGNTSANTKIWGQTITVESNKYYAFYAYVTPVYTTNPPIIQFSINGNVLGTPFNSPGGTCTWNKFYAIWYSGTNTTADISIVNQNITANGNDFAIDDIKYVELCKTVDTVTVTVGSLTSTTNIVICNSELPYTWNTQPYSSSGTYTTHLTSSIGCDSTAILNLTVKPMPAVTNTALTQTICSGESTELVTLTSDVASTTFEWTATTDTGISGFTTSGTNTIPAQILTNPGNSTAGTVTYVIIPTANGCTGTAVNYVVTVTPKPITSDIYHE